MYAFILHAQTRPEQAEAFERLFGYAAADILGQPIACLTADGRSRFPPDTILERLRIQNHWQGEDWRRHADGHAVAVRISAIRRENAAGELTGFVSMFVDLSDSKRREAQLRTLHRVTEELSGRLGLDNLARHAVVAAAQLTDAEFAALAVPTADGTCWHYRWWKLPDTTDAAVSAQLAQSFARDLDTVGQALRAARPVLTADYASVAAPVPALRALGAVTVLDYPIEAQAVLTVASLGRPCQFDADAMCLLDTVVRQVAVALERERLIAEACLSSQRLDQIIRNNADAILVTDDTGTIKFANPAAQRLLGRAECELLDFPLGLTSHAPGEMEVHRPNGDSVPVDLHAMETTWDGQRAHVLTLRDATERRLVAEERRRGSDRIRRALVQTIEAISRTVETRDPYTAGHQRRVAALARIVAREMGLDTETVDGVYMGGMIHDIGKLYIPAEILNRSGRLNEVEFLLMKTHCAVGRDIIGSIEFPWPLAAMIHQHHERLDGSGYPQGLRGEQILLEARILAVADVVDAMSSRRPYREALGLDAAMQAIEQGRGRFFDPAAVDVCQRLFVQRGLTMTELESGS